jgi:hypothetical protein
VLLDLLSDFVAVRGFEQDWEFRGALPGVSGLLGRKRLRRDFCGGLLRLFDRLGLLLEGGEEVALVGDGVGAASGERGGDGESEEGSGFHGTDGSTPPR